MSTFVTRSLNSPQMCRCYIMEPVWKVFTFRENVWMNDISLSSAGRLLQMTAADRSSANSGADDCS